MIWARERNEDFKEAFGREAGEILRWGLLLFLVRRSRELRQELIGHGLTETLLLALLDFTHPVRQGTALAELHHLRLLSPAAEKVVSFVLCGKKELLKAMSLNDFVEAASAEDMRRARFHLRSLQMCLLKGTGSLSSYGAIEFELAQDILDRDMSELFPRPEAGGSSPREGGGGDGGSVFLTAVAASSNEPQQELRERAGTDSGTSAAKL